MESTMIVTAVISILLLSVLGGVVLHICAKYIARINSATYKQSFLVCLLSSVVIGVIWWVIDPSNLLSWGLVGIILFNLAVQAGVFISVGKALWNCSWIESSKANALWIILLGGQSIWMLNQLS